MSEISASKTSKGYLWAGRILTGLVTLILFGSGIAKISGAPQMVEGLTRARIPQQAILAIASIELLCLVLYLIPRTAVLGTLLLTGYFGGATVVHVIIAESVMPPLVIGLIIWSGAYFRVPELRDLIPLRKAQERREAYLGPQAEAMRGI